MFVYQLRGKTNKQTNTKITLETLSSQMLPSSCSVLPSCALFFPFFLTPTLFLFPYLLFFFLHPLFLLFYYVSRASSSRVLSSLRFVLARFRQQLAGRPLQYHRPSAGKLTLTPTTRYSPAKIFQSRFFLLQFAFLFRVTGRPAGLAKINTVIYIFSLAFSLFLLFSLSF